MNPSFEGWAASHKWVIHCEGGQRGDTGHACMEPRLTTHSSSGIIGKGLLRKALSVTQVGPINGGRKAKTAPPLPLRLYGFCIVDSRKQGVSGRTTESAKSGNSQTGRNKKGQRILR